MPYLIKRTSDGKWVARPGSRRSYTSDQENAAEFTREEAQCAACGNESIWYVVSKPVLVHPSEVSDGS